MPGGLQLTVNGRNLQLYTPEACNLKQRHPMQLHHGYKWQAAAWSTELRKLVAPSRVEASVGASARCTRRRLMLNSRTRSFAQALDDVSLCKILVCFVLMRGKEDG
eukprot:3084236-Amphidinium_carterae.1